MSPVKYDVKKILSDKDFQFYCEGYFKKKSLVNYFENEKYPSVAVLKGFLDFSGIPKNKNEIKKLWLEICLNKNSNKEIFEVFLDNVSNENINDQYGDGQNTLLHIFCEQSRDSSDIEINISIIKFLLNKGADPAIKASGGESPVGWAFGWCLCYYYRNNNEKILKFLEIFKLFLSYSKIFELKCLNRLTSSDFIKIDRHLYYLCRLLRECKTPEKVLSVLSDKEGGDEVWSPGLFKIKNNYIPVDKILEKYTLEELQEITEKLENSVEKSEKISPRNNK